uniref:translation initiation factor IF-2-like n=1 Tax=Agelaius phoeniceus TaxID=39638 RepID=UPI0023EAA934|nr:translation initiation factor IF-2-like [Agelaius phoeniceus]
MAGRWRAAPLPRPPRARAPAAEPNCSGSPAHPGEAAATHARSAAQGGGSPAPPTRAPPRVAPPAPLPTASRGAAAPAAPRPRRHHCHPGNHRALPRRSGAAGGAVGGGSLHPSPRLPAHPRRAAGTDSGVRSHREKLCSLPRRSPPSPSPPIPGKRRGRSGAAQAAPAGPDAGRRAGGQLRPRRRRGQPGHGAGQRGEPRIPPPNFFSSATSPFSKSPPTPPTPTPPPERPGGRQRAAVREPPRCGQRCRERRGLPGSRERGRRGRERG